MLSPLDVYMNTKPGEAKALVLVSKADFEGA